MAILYVGLGSNQGERGWLMSRALDLLEERIGRIIGRSALYETEPWGFTSEYPFLNAVAALETGLKPFDVLRITQQIEIELGRKQKSRDGGYADRTMDIDLLFYDDLCLDSPMLVLPHPLMHLRDFVLRPMVDLAPDFRHPVLQRTMSDLLQELERTSGEKTIIKP